MAAQNVRDIFNKISHSVISFLESHSGVTEIEFNERTGVVEAMINAWEEENSPYTLPNDIKSFLQISDGILLTWKIIMNNQIYPLGQMHINKLKDIRLLDIDRFVLRKLGEEVDSDLSEEEEPGNIKAFDLDNKVKDGRLALLYKDSVSKPQIYFQDLSGQWFFIANSFTDYFRLMVMHLGLPHWQYAFTEVGLDSSSQRWFRFLSPERLAIDIKSRKKHVKKAKKKQTKKERIIIQPMRKRRNPSGFYSHLLDSKRDEDRNRNSSVKKKKKKGKKKVADSESKVDT